MLGSRSQNILSTSSSEATFTSSSTPYVAYKTPARSLKHGRAVHDENAIYGHPKTAGPTRRKKRDAVAFDTPAIGVSLKPHLKTEKIPRTASKASALSEITNKTPFNKPHIPVTPVPASLKSSKLFAIPNDDSGILSARRISSTRKKLRLPRSASKTFETPETRGNHWDVSDMSMEVSVIEETIAAAEDYDDVEYGPPTAIDPQYEPPFDMPDYKEVGKTLMSLFRQQALPEDYDPVEAFDNTELLAELSDLKWEETLELPAIPLENIFPSMVRREPPLSLTTENRLQPRNAGSTVATLNNMPRHATHHSSRLKSSIQINQSVRTPSSLAKPLPGHPVSKTVDRMMISHTRIPSLNNVAQITSPVAETQKLTRSHSRTMVASHSRATSVSRSRPPSILHSRNASIPKSISSGKETHGSTPHPVKVLEDTLQPLLPSTGEEFLFDV